MGENSKEKNIGEVCIADEVVAVIAGLAACEVEGVDSMAGKPAWLGRMRRAVQR